MCYGSNCKYLSIECGDFDLSEQYFEEEISKLEEFHIITDIHFVDVSRINSTIKNVPIGIGGGFELPEIGQLLIGFFDNQYVSSILGTVLGSIISKAIEVFLEKRAPKSDDQKSNSNIEIFESDNIKYLKVSGLPEKSAEEIAEVFIKELKK